MLSRPFEKKFANRLNALANRLANRFLSFLTI